MCSDEKLIEFIPVVINSVMGKNSHHVITIHYIHNIEDDSKVSKLVSTLELHKNVQVKTYYKTWDYKYNSPLKKAISPATMLRLFIPELIDCEKLVYLDIDVIVNCDLEQLADIDCGGTGVTLKDSIMDTWVKSKVGKTSGNAGVAVFDIPTLVENDFTNKCLDIVNSGKYGNNLHDQDAINIFCEGKHTKLPKQFNIFINQDDELLKKHSEYILHYAGSKKPFKGKAGNCLLYTSPSPRDQRGSRMPSSA